MRPTSSNHQRPLDDEPRTRWLCFGVERAGAWSADSSDNADGADLPCAGSVGPMLKWNNSIPANDVLEFASATYHTVWFPSLMVRDNCHRNGLRRCDRPTMIVHNETNRARLW
jgi:hypothetical protein